MGLISWIVSPLSHKGTGAREKVGTYGWGQREEWELDSLKLTSPKPAMGLSRLGSVSLEWKKCIRPGWEFLWHVAAWCCSVWPLPVCFPGPAAGKERWRQHPPHGLPKKKMGWLRSSKQLLLLCGGHSPGEIQKCTWAGSVCGKAGILAH